MPLYLKSFRLLLFLWFLGLASAPAESFPLRGYYLTFMRMPVMGLPEWKETVDRFAEDGANTVILWMPGGFRSEKFPETWRYNEEHLNVRHDFAKELIDYAHTRNIRVLLGFTPFGYDGVNQFSLTRPELKAKKADGSPVDEFGIHCWGWSLCPSQPESQRLMREYLREMIFDFYPNADGLLVESSDYNVCRCSACQEQPYEEEFKLTQWISEELWKVKPEALILVYPHYFTGRNVPGLEGAGMKKPFDPRWGLFFTPHSAHFDAGLIRQAKASVFSGPETILGTPQGVASAAQEARRQGVTGFMPSLETFSYIPSRPEGGEPFVVGKRMKPLGFDAAGEGRMPYDTLPMRVQRFAMREFSADPDLNFADFEKRLAAHIFGDGAKPEALADLLALQRLWNEEAGWYWRSPLLDPDLFRALAQRLHWPEAKLKEYDGNLAAFSKIASRHANSTNPAEREMSRLAGEVVKRWTGRQPSEISAPEAR